MLDGGFNAFSARKIASPYAQVMTTCCGLLIPVAKEYISRFVSLRGR